MYINHFWEQLYWKLVKSSFCNWKKFYQTVDVMVSLVKDRFDQPSLKVFKKLESLMIKALNGGDTSSQISFLKKLLEQTLMLMIVVELSTFNVILKDQSIEHFHDLIKRMKLLPEAEKKLLNNVCKICKILVVNPASSSTADRTFSLARRVKTWMRSTMLPSRFNLSRSCIFIRIVQTSWISLKLLTPLFKQMKTDLVYLVNLLRMICKYDTFC